MATLTVDQILTIFDLLIELDRISTLQAVKFMIDTYKFVVIIETNIPVYLILTHN